MRSRRYKGESFASLSEIDRGVLYITSKRIFFDGALKNTSLRYSTIAQIKVFDGGIEIEKQTGKSPVLHIEHEAERAAAIAQRALVEQGQDN